MPWVPLAALPRLRRNPGQEARAAALTLLMCEPSKACTLAQSTCEKDRKSVLVVVVLQVLPNEFVDDEVLCCQLPPRRILNAVRVRLRKHTDCTASSSV